MYSIQKINNIDFELKYNFLNFFKDQNFGTSIFFLRKLELRFELSKTCSFDILEKSQVVALVTLLYRIFPPRLFFKNYFLLNIIFLDFSYSYRG